MNDFERALLKKALENGMIDLTTIEAQVDEMEKSKYLAMHNYKIWQGTDKKWYTYFPDRLASNGRRLIKRARKSDIITAIVDYYRLDEESPIFEKVYTTWINSKLKFGEITQETFDRYQTDYIRFFKDSNIRYMHFNAIDENVLEDFIKSTIRDKNLTAKAWSGLRTIINGTFKYAKRHEYTDISISIALDDMDLSQKAFKRKKKDDKTQVFTDSEVEKLEAFVSENPSIEYLSVIFAFKTGMRCGELAALQWSDFGKDAIYVQKTEISYKSPESGKRVYEIRPFTKGKDGERYVILTPSAKNTVQEIRRLNPFGEYVFMMDGERMKAQAFGRAIRKLCRESGLETRSIHKARKTYATNLKKHGVDDKVIQKQLGHADIATTNGYYYFDNRDFTETQELLAKCEIN